jgi:hypothetical protein
MMHNMDFRLTVHWPTELFDVVPDMVADDRNLRGS